MLEENKISFIELLLSKQALKFGDFTLPSGNKTPYFFNIGEINSGEGLDLLSIYYSELIYSLFLCDLDNTKKNLPIIFGAAYKGIPIASTTVSKIYQSYKISLDFACNRKEPKAHGEGGFTMGADLCNRDVIIVDDVIAEGITLVKTYNFLEQYGARVKGLIVALDRKDPVPGYSCASEKINENLKLPVHSIINFSDILSYTSNIDQYQHIHEKLISDKK